VEALEGRADRLGRGGGGQTRRCILYSTPATSRPQVVGITTLTLSLLKTRKEHIRKKAICFFFFFFKEGYTG
jgi:hypothetical protein